VLVFLHQREGLLDAVVFSGGEPLSQLALVDAVRTVSHMRFRVGLHTGGAYPARLAAVLPMLDWVGFDIKAPFTEYASVTGVPGSGEKARASARLVIESGVAHEFRTTVHPELLAPVALEWLAAQVAGLGLRAAGVSRSRLCERGIGPIRPRRTGPRLSASGTRVEVPIVRAAPRLAKGAARTGAHSACPSA
jgi:pyruvate formate lyase activating enzyme